MRAHVLSIKFRAEQNRDKVTRELMTENVRILADMSCNGRLKVDVKIRLNHINDFDVTKQKLLAGKKAKHGTMEMSAVMVNEFLKSFEMQYYDAYKAISASGQPFTVKDIHERVKGVSAPAASADQSVMPAESKVTKSAERAMRIISKLAERYFQSNTIGRAQYSRYVYLATSIDTYERITNKHLVLNKLTFDEVLSYREFLKDEHEYALTHPDYFKDYSRIPKAQKGANTLSMYMGILSSVLNDLKYTNPLTGGNKSGRSLLAEKYGQPVYLTLEELKHCIAADYPAELKLDRDCFLIQCSIGLRVGDYYRISKEEILYTSEGNPYISYVAQKTMKSNKVVEVIETPILKFAMDIVKEYGYMPFRDYLYGDITTTYNANIRRLMEHWGIDRRVMVLDGDAVVKMPLYTQASSKLARKTFVDIIYKSQLNPYLSGVHKEGSKAVHRYTQLTINDKYKLFSLAFDQDV